MNEDLEKPKKYKSPIKKFLKKMNSASIAKKEIGCMYIDGKSVYSTMADTFCSINVYIALFLSIFFSI
jgi:hypothetical protein